MTHNEAKALHFGDKIRCTDSLNSTVLVENRIYTVKRIHEYEIDAEAPRVAIEITEYAYASFSPGRFETDDGFCGECNQYGDDCIC